jgi:hypothetical protein
MLGRYYSPRDQRLIQSINIELMDNIIQSFVKIYRISANDTITNDYGESTGLIGKVYFPGVLMSALIINSEQTTKQDGAGSDRTKIGMRFALNENMCKKANFFPNDGDIIEWDRSFYEVGNPVQNQYLASQWDKSWSIILEAHLSKTSKLNIVERAQDTT